ncbi:MAG: hypothetical protein JKY84_09095 [Emcibacteraceae bacterium]|nr:hypothetical protein [Emcibacteraceae bacterium]
MIQQRFVAMKCNIQEQNQELRRDIQSFENMNTGGSKILRDDFNARGNEQTTIRNRPRDGPRR